MTSPRRHKPKDHDSQVAPKSEHLNSSLESPRIDARIVEASYGSFLDALPNALVMVDTSGKIVLVNAQTEKLFGYKRDELIGKSVETLVPERYRSLHPRHRTMFMGDPRTRPMGRGRDLFGLRKDGHEFPIEIGLNPMDTEQGLFVLASIVDITERKRAEERFRMVVESAPNAILLVNRDGIIEMANSQTEKFFGYSREQLVGLDVERLVPERFRSIHPGHRKSFLANPQIRSMGAGRDLHGVCKDGSEFPVEIGLTPIETSTGMLVMVTIVDITERKQAEAAVRESHERLEKVLEVETVGVMFWDLTTGCMTNANDAFLNLMGYSRRDVDAGELTWQKLTPPEYMEASLAEIRKFQATGRVGPYEKEYFRKDGTRQWLIFAGSSLGSNTCVEFCVDISPRKQAEEQLRRSEENFSKAFNSSPTALMITRRSDGKYLELNKAYTSIVGYDRAELIGHLTTEFNIFINPDQRKEILTLLLANDSLYNYEAQIQNKSGEFLTVLASLEQIQFNGEDCILTTLVDITSRKQTEEALKVSEAKFRSFFENSPLGISLTTIEGQLNVNQAFCELVGYSEDELRAKNWKDISHPDEIQLTLDVIQSLMEGKVANARFEKRYIHKNGNVIWADVTTAIQRDKNGDPLCFLTSVNDITGRKRAEEALAREQALLQMLVENLPEEVYIKDRERRFLLVNDLVVQALGVRSKDEVIGMRDEDFMPPDLAKQFADEEDEIMRLDKALMNDEHLPPHRPGSPKWYLRTKLPLHDETGQIIGLVGLGRDITERKQAEQAIQAKSEELKAMSQQLWQAAKLATMGELAASIAHELNNPLATISLRAEMLQMQFNPNDAQFKSLQVIDSEIKRMSSLVANLLQFSRSSSSQISTLNVNEEITNTLELIQYHLRKNSIQAVQKLSSDLSLVQADRQQLRQVFLNLFTNAADAMPLGGILTIRTWSGETPGSGTTTPLQRSPTKPLGLSSYDTPQVSIEVSDTGEGISPDRLERVWEPFYTTKAEGKGTGLGLAICRRIIHEHGGTIELDSDGIPGKGTTVRLTLPAVKGS